MYALYVVSILLSSYSATGCALSIILMIDIVVQNFEATLFSAKELSVSISGKLTLSAA